MGSMSYCLFENTAGELSRCVDKMSEVESLSDMKFNEYELRAFHEMRRTAREFLAEHERLLRADIARERKNAEAV
jgi:hypothetical protein